MLVRRRKWGGESGRWRWHLPSRLTAMLGGGFRVLTDQVDLDLSSCLGASSGLVGEGKSENKPIDVYCLICV